MIPPLYQNPVKDGGPIGWLSCNSTCTAMLIAFESGGTKKPSGGDVRACTRNANGQPDVLGGTTPSQNIDAAQRCWGIQLDGRMMPFEEAWTLSNRTDTALSFSISYAVISGTRFDGSPGFRGYHQIVRTGGEVYDPLADGRRPGIPNAPEKWPKDLLRRAAGKYASIGEGRAAVIVAHAPTTKPTKYSVLFEPGAIFVYSHAGGKWHRDPDSFPNKTSASSTGPFLVPWPGGRKRLVTIVDGRLSGKSVEPTAVHMKLRSSV